MDDEFGQDYLYKIQLLQAFGLNEWDDDKVNDIIYDTYTEIKDINVFRDIIESAKKNKEMINLLALICEEDENESIDRNKLVFELLFKYEFFDLIHKCLSEHFREGRVKESTKELLVNLLRTTF